MNFLLLVPYKAYKFFKYKVPNLMRRLVTLARYYEVDESALTHDFKARIAGTWCVIDKEEDLETYREDIPSHYMTRYREWLSRHHDWMVAYVADGRCLFWIWLSVERKVYFETCVWREIHLPEDAVYLFDAHTLPEYRRKGINTAFYTYLPTLLRKLNKKRFFFVVRRRDKPANAVIRKLGFKPRKKMGYVNLGRVKLPFTL